MFNNIIQYVLKIIMLVYFFLFSMSLILFSMYGLVYGKSTDKSNYWSLITNVIGFVLGLVTSLITNGKDNILKSSIRKITSKSS